MCSWWKTCSWTFWDWTRAWTTWRLSSRQDPDPGYSNAVLDYTYVGTAVVVILIVISQWEFSLCPKSENAEGEFLKYFSLLGQSGIFHSWDRVRILTLGTGNHSHSWDRVGILTVGTEWEFSLFGQVKISVPAPSGKFPYFAQINTSPTIFGKYQKKHLKQIFIVVKISESNTTQLVF